MKEPEPQSPGPFEQLGIKAALWFEGKLDEWYMYPGEVAKWNKRGAASLAVLGVLGLGVWACTLRQKTWPQVKLPLLDSKSGIHEARLEYSQFISSKRWILANYATGLAIRVHPDLFDQIIKDRLVDIVLPENITAVTFLVGDTLHKQPAKDNLLDFVQKQHKVLLDQSKQTLDPAGSGLSFRKVISIVDRQKVVLSRKPQDYNITSPFNSMMMSVDLSFAWIASLKEIALGNTFPEVSQSDLAPQIRELVTSTKINGIPRFPLEVEYLQPDYVERAKRV